VSHCEPCLVERDGGRDGATRQVTELDAERILGDEVFVRRRLECGRRCSRLARTARAGLERERRFLREHETKCGVPADFDADDFGARVVELRIVAARHVFVFHPHISRD
jgi:hypothetical protein